MTAFDLWWEGLGPTIPANAKDLARMVWDGATEWSAQVAAAQIGAAERDRIAKGRKPNQFMSEEAMASIRDEERGETIAAQIIAANIRKLSN